MESDLSGSSSYAAFSSHRQRIEELAAEIQSWPILEPWQPLPPSLHTVSESQLQEYWQQYEDAEAEISEIDQGDLTKLRELAKTTSRRVKSSQDADIVEVALMTLVGLDRVLALLRHRLQLLELVDARLKWEHALVQSKQELGDFVSTTLPAFLTKARWIPPTADQPMADDATLPANLASISTRLTTLQTKQIPASGAALDTLIDASLEPLPDEFLDTQDLHEEDVQAKITGLAPSLTGLLNQRFLARRVDNDLRTLASHVIDAQDQIRAEIEGTPTLARAGHFEQIALDFATQVHLSQQAIQSLPLPQHHLLVELPRHNAAVTAYLVQQHVAINDSVDALLALVKRYRHCLTLAEAALQAQSDLLGADAKLVAAIAQLEQTSQHLPALDDPRCLANASAFAEPLSDCKFLVRQLHVILKTVDGVVLVGQQRRSDLIQANTNSQGRYELSQALQNSLTTRDRAQMLVKDHNARALALSAASAQWQRVLGLHSLLLKINEQTGIALTHEINAPLAGASKLTRAPLAIAALPNVADLRLETSSVAFHAHHHRTLDRLNTHRDHLAATRNTCESVRAQTEYVRQYREKGERLAHRISAVSDPSDEVKADLLVSVQQLKQSAHEDLPLVAQAYPSRLFLPVSQDSGWNDLAIPPTDDIGTALADRDSAAREAVNETTARLEAALAELNRQQASAVLAQRLDRLLNSMRAIDLPGLIATKASDELPARSSAHEAQQTHRSLRSDMHMLLLEADKHDDLSSLTEILQDVDAKLTSNIERLDLLAIFGQLTEQCDVDIGDYLDTADPDGSQPSTPTTQSGISNGNGHASTDKSEKRSAAERRLEGVRKASEPIAQDIRVPYQLQRLESALREAMLLVNAPRNDTPAIAAVDIPPEIEPQPEQTAAQSPSVQLKRASGIPRRTFTPTRIPVAVASPKPQERPRIPVEHRPYVADESAIDQEVGKILNKLETKVNVRRVVDNASEKTTQTGRYHFGEDRRLYFCRILRDEVVMVRVGGGWQELGIFLSTRYPHNDSGHATPLMRTVGSSAAPNMPRLSDPRRKVSSTTRSADFAADLTRKLSGAHVSQA
ncbi:uncharacterized protein L969DRAFT_89080 [Mixia osmundae IAM 14324]|uniref:GAR domain-containing protein n=1 Tax=Mixia osmundae (strain CBS 9802 / IAM 14324 / JCM 22182 / KY 12970) TaxID=764103 RepID=G7EAD3_MIXOS|nr:uncharacterized protein L969DRAFT_89080 [Mixia osmundae IAM 14324]KEI37851.1 hypothetical protein L969DRAFT_89080 [Mixia osmundae IAM 14324]GAA99793.1 hypothetical protein E5Q_06496 [Mixia osmundae IAM 14324]